MEIIFLELITLAPSLGNPEPDAASPIQSGSPALWFLPITIILVLTLVPSIRLLRRTGQHVALAALNLIPIWGTIILIWIIAYSNWPNTMPPKVRTETAPPYASDRGEANASEEDRVRPKAIVYFERIILGVVLLGVLQSYLGWDRAIARAATLGQNSPVATILTIIIFMFVLFGTLTLLVSRGRSKIAMWVLIAMFVIGFPALVQQITREQDILTAIEVIAQFVAYGLLFTPSARRWMNRKDEKLAEVFH